MTANDPEHSRRAVTALNVAPMDSEAGCRDKARDAEDGGGNPGDAAADC